MVFYSQGYRFDYKTIAIQKVGGVFVKSEPSDTLIFLDGAEVKNQSWFLQSGTLINNLVPGAYTLEVKKDGYRPWRKTVTIESSLVTEADAVTLIPEKEPTLLDSGIRDAQISGKNIIEQEVSGTIIINRARLAATGTLLAVSPDGASGLFMRATSKSYFIRDLKDGSPTLNISLLFNNLKERILQSPGTAILTNVAYYPNDSQKFFLSTDRAVYLMDKEKLTLALLDNAGVHYFKVTDRGLFWVNDKSELRKYTFENRDRATIMTDASDVTDIQTWQNSEGGGFAVLKKNGLLFLFDQTFAQKQEIASQAALMAFSPDNQRVAFIDKNNQINIQNLTKQKKKISFVLPIAGIIDAFSWQRDSQHLFIHSGAGKLYFTETDGIMPVNNYLLVNEVGKYIYNGDVETLFMLRDTDLFQFSLK